jgi:hypothetical protein
MDMNIDIKRLPDVLNKIIWEYISYLQLDQKVEISIDHYNYDVAQIVDINSDGVRVRIPLRNNCCYLAAYDKFGLLLHGGDFAYEQFTVCYFQSPLLPPLLLPLYHPGGGRSNNLFNKISKFVKYEFSIIEPLDVYEVHQINSQSLFDRYY